MDNTSKKAPEWQYDEFKHVGVDYADINLAEEYDNQHGKFRDYEKDALLIIERLNLNQDHTVIDLGCGTGAFVIPMARICKKVHAVDVSPAMLSLCDKKVQRAGLDNVMTHCAGFLTYQHEDEPADAIISVVALHHLPDFWKALALKRMHAMLKPGGRLYLFDVVFSFPIEDCRTQFDSLINGMYQQSGESMANETIIHIRDEFSTFDWIMEGLLERTGFSLEEKYSDFPLTIAYLASKPADD